MSHIAAIQESEMAFKRLLARKLMAGMTLLVTIGLPISLSRWPDLGFQYVFVHHIILTLVTYVCYFRPDKANYKIDFLFVVVALSSMIISGTLSFGLQTGAITFTVFCTFILAFAWGIKIASAYAICWCLFLLACGYLFVTDSIQYLVEPNTYSQSFGAWAIVAFGSSLTIIFMLIVAKQGYTFLNQLIDEIEKQKREIEHLANTDGLTGFNAQRLATPLLEQTLNQAKRDGDKVAVCFIDLNKFKHINDTFGHAVGDIVLKTAADRVKECLRTMDITCRIGGDEFLIILPKVHNSLDISEILTRIVNTWKLPIKFDHQLVYVSASIGVSVFPNDAQTAEDLRRHADSAMYLAKSQNMPIKFYSSID